MVDTSPGHDDCPYAVALALVPRDVERLSAPELVKILRISVEAVKSRLHRARVAIREELAPALGRQTIAPRRGALCSDVLTLFSQHLEGEIDLRVCATMEAHLAQCHNCRDGCESLKRALATRRQLPTPAVPASLAASVKAAMRSFLNQREEAIPRGIARHGDVPTSTAWTLRRLLE